MIVFAPIMQMLADAGWTSYRLRAEKALPESTLTRIRNGDHINTRTIDNLCRLIGCQPGDLIRYEPDPPQK